MINTLCGEVLHRYIVYIRQENEKLELTTKAIEYFSPLYYAADMEQLYNDIAAHLQKQGLIGLGHNEVEFMVTKINAIVMN